MTVRWPELSIRARLVLATAALLGAISLAPLLVLPDQLQAHEREELQRRAVDLAGAFGAASQAALDFGDRQRAAEVLRGLASAGDATYGILVRGDGSVLASWGRGSVALLPPSPDGPTLRLSPDELHARVPVVTPAGEHGAIQLGLDLETLRRRQAESRDLVLRTAAASFVVGLAAVFLIATLLTKPVRTLTALARRIASGDERAAAQLASGRDEAGTVAAALGSVVARLATQRAMLESQSEATSEGILTLDAGGAVITHNRRLREMLGLGAEALQGGAWRSLRAVVAGRLAAPLPPWLAADAPALSAPESFDVATDDGRTFAVHAAPVRRPTGEPLGLGLYFRDVTRAVQDRRAIEELALGLERRVEQRTRELAAANEELATRLAELHRTQEQLVLADRRISVGRLAAGVAHEVNNPLSYLLGNVNWVLEELVAVRAAVEAVGEARAPLEARLERIRTALEDAAEGGQRVAHIVRELRTFSRGDEERRGPTDLRRAMLAALEMARHELRLRAQVVERLGDAPPVDGNEVRLSQVFLNLLINAGQAIEPGAMDRNVIEATIGTDPDGWAFAEVRDTGSGMSAEIQRRIFDPFFTTKAQGQGTGLGLSISQGIVTSSGGTIAVSSSPGRGSTFRVRLPPTRAEPAPRSAPEPPLPRDRRKLLVVDDEPLVLDCLVRTLSGEHDVTAVHTASEALERIRGGERYDRILCDLMMPVMSGMELHDELLRVAPDQAGAMVFISGGAFTASSDAFVEANRDRFVPKPVDAMTLRRVIHASPPG